MQNYSDYNLNFITNANLFTHVKNTVEKYRFSINLAQFNKNLIDPVKLTFDSKVYGKKLEDIIEAEVIRQMDKSNTNHIGYFHQNIFQYLGNGWELPEKGYDIIHQDKNLFVEMKNKHNTMNSSSAQKNYMKMQATILENDKAVCMLVEVIAKKSQNEKWNITLDKQPFSHERIRRVSIDKFYGLVTGDKCAFKKLCDVLPTVISDVIKSLKIGNIDNTVFKELKKLSPDIWESIFLLSFSKYEGFQKKTV